MKNQKKRKKKSSAGSKLFFLMIFAIIALTCAIFAVKFNTPTLKSVQVHTKITNNGATVLDYPITVSGANPNAADAFIKGCEQKDISYKFDNGMFDGFADVFSTATDGWLFYVNNTLSNVGAQEYIINEGDTIEFKFANYAAEFPNLAPSSSPQVSTAENSIPVKIKISANDKVLTESTVSADKDTPTAEDALKNLCELNSSLYTITSGNLVSYGDFANTQSEKWNFYLNGKKSEQTLDSQQLSAGDVLEFKYETAE